MKPASADPPAPAPATRSHSPSPRLIYGVVGLLALAVAGGSWQLKRLIDHRAAASGKSLPVLGTITGDLAATTSEGRPARFSDLKGKVIACSYLYTKCPHGCALVFGSMRRLHEQFGSRPDFHVASIAVLPEQDPPAFLREFASGQGISARDSWTFYSGFARETAWAFMHQNLKMEMTRETPPGERVSDCDFCEHDLRIALIDRQGRVRGLYQVMNPNAAARELTVAALLGDTKRLLDDPAL